MWPEAYYSQNQNHPIANDSTVAIAYHPPTIPTFQGIHEVGNC
jgi:hypothetical protein